MTSTMFAFLMAAILLAAAPRGSRGSSPPRLVRAEVGAAAWNVASGGIAAFDVQVDEKGAVTAADMVQDAAPFGAARREALGRWSFEPTRPPMLTFAAPENPR